MEERLAHTLLYDFYGELLTEKQKQVFEYFYLQDFTLSEIGEELGISRQAVRDQLKRTEKILQEYEKKLQLVEKFMAHKNAVKRIKVLACELEKMAACKVEAAEKMRQIEKIADDILD